MKSIKKPLLISALVVIILIAVVFKMLTALEVVTEKVRKSVVAETVMEKGKVISQQSGDIFSEVQGKISALYVDEGDLVKKGTVLALIEVTDIDSQISQLEGDLKALKGSERVSQAQTGSSYITQQQLAWERAVSDYELAKTTYQRNKDLYAEGAVTLSELEVSKTDMDGKKKAVDQANVALSSAKKQNQGSSMQFQGQKQSMEARLKYLKSLKGKANIVATKDDMIYKKDIKVGDFVSPGTKLFTLGNTGKVKIEAYLISKDIAYLKVGDETKVIFKLPGEDVEEKGVITKIAPSAEEKVSALGVLEDRVKITIELQAQPKKINITPGTSVDVTMTTQKTAVAVIAVPKDAVFTDNEKDFVWLNQDGTATLVNIVTGIEGDELIEVKKGLSDGMFVLLNPHQEGLKEGLKIK
jgi:HlyD family secretion protein